MTNIYLYIFNLVFLIFLQLFKTTKLPTFQFYEGLFGSIFIVVFFGLFGAMLTLNPEMIEYSIVFASYFIVWYYLTKKLTNLINMDRNGVIYYN
tara:strand:- start:335 stop:616 length:282 start_codon:yes stop_codon:yes gene_type:complete